MAQKRTFYSEEKLNVKPIKELQRILNEFAHPVSPNTYSKRLDRKYPWIQAILATQEKEKEQKRKSAITKLSLFNGCSPNDSIGDGDEEASGIPSPTAENQSGQGAVCFVGEPPAPIPPSLTPPPLPSEDEDCGIDQEDELITGEGASQPSSEFITGEGESVSASKIQIGSWVKNVHPSWWPLGGSER